MSLYETVFIGRQDLTAEDVDNLVEKFSKIIADNGGKVVSREYWGLRTLAYPVKKNSRGHYVLLNIKSPSAAVAELKRIMSHDDNVIRTLTFSVEAHEKHSVLFVSEKAADAKKARSDNKEPTKTDLILDQLNFEII